MSRTSKKDRQAIFDKTNGRCYYCGTTLKKGWHVDHIEPVQRVLETIGVDPAKNRGSNYRLISRGKMHYPDLDTIENKAPSCPRCNLWKHSMSLETFRREVSQQVQRLSRYSNQFRLAMDFGLIEETGTDVTFYFEKELKKSRSR